MKICCFVVCYFGTLPRYMPYVLKTCAASPDYNWLLFTDDSTPYDYPENFRVEITDFADFKRLVGERFDFDLCIPTPKKLCDFKPAYGYIFSQYLADYPFWGHCDLDEFFGNLSQYISLELLEGYDKIYTLGHMSIYRNIPQINNLFMVDYNHPTAKYTSYKQVFQSPYGCSFDEWPDNCVNINVLAEQENIRIRDDSPMLDIVGNRSYFLSAAYDRSIHRWITQLGKQYMVCFDGKEIYYLECSKNNLVQHKALYAHLQKRQFSVKLPLDKAFVIIPNKIIPCSVEILKNKRWIKRQIRRSKIRSVFKVDECKNKLKQQKAFVVYQIKKRFRFGKKGTNA